MNRMTVKELIEKLSKFDENMTVKIGGGEGGEGEWAELEVGETYFETYTMRNGNEKTIECFSPAKTLMEYSY